MKWNLTDPYFVVPSLPEIRLGEPLELNFEQFDRLLTSNLGKEDLAQIAIVRRYYDLQNLRYLMNGIEPSSYGTMNAEELDEAVINGIGLPDYFYDFLEKYEEKEERLHHFPKLIADYYRSEKATGFVQELLAFERDVRLVLTALRAKFLNKDIMSELQFEDQESDLVQQIIAQKDAKSYEPPAKYEGLKAIYESKKEEPFELYQAIGEYRFHHIEEMLGVETFTLNRIIGYMVQLIIAEEWLTLDKQKGIEILDTILEEKA